MLSVLAIGRKAGERKKRAWAVSVWNAGGEEAAVDP